MPPVSKPSTERYDYIIIGGGSGASASSVRFLALAHTDSGSPFFGLSRSVKVSYLRVVLRIVGDRDVLLCMARRSLWSRALVRLVGAALKLVRSLCDTIF